MGSTLDCRTAAATSTPPATPGSSASSTPRAWTAASTARPPSSASSTSSSMRSRVGSSTGISRASAATAGSGKAPRFLAALQDAHGSLWAVTSALGSSIAPGQQELSGAKAAMEKLQHSLGHAGLSFDDATYLLLFIFRPFLAPILTTVSASTAPCTFTLLQLLQHMLQLLSPGAGQPEGRFQVLAAHLLADLAACSFYSRDPAAAKWLASEQPAKAGIAGYMKGSPRYPNKPLPAAASREGSSGTSSSNSSSAPGLQALLDVLQYAPGSSASGIDSACFLAQQLVVGAHNTGSTLGATSFTYAHSSSASRGALREVSVVWGDGSRQTVHDGVISPRYAPDQLVLGLLAGSPTQQLPQHMQSLLAALRQLCSPDADRDTTSSVVVPELQQQQHAVQCIMQLVEHSAGGGASQAAAAAAADVKCAPLFSATISCDDQGILQEPGAGSPLPVQLQQALLGKLAQLLLHKPLPSSAAQQLMDVVGRHWPLQDAQLRRHWMLGTAPAAASAAPFGPTGHVASNSSSSSSSSLCEAVVGLPTQQQQGVLQLLSSSLQCFPDDARQLPTRQLSDLLVQLLAARQQLSSASCDGSGGSASADTTQLALALLQALDGGMGAVYSSLMCQLDVPCTEDEQQQQQQVMHRRSSSAAVAAYNNCSAVRLLLHLAAAGQPDDDFPAEVQLPAISSDRPATLLLLVRLLPHVPDSNLAAAAVQRCLFNGSSPLQNSITLLAAPDQQPNHVPGAACTLAACSLQPKEQRAVLQLLHDLDAAAGLRPEQQGGWLSLYLADLFSQLVTTIESPTADSNDAAAAGAGAGAQVQLAQLADILSEYGSWQVQQQQHTPARQAAGLAAALRAEGSQRMRCSRCWPSLSSSRQAAASSHAVVFFSTEQQAVERSKQRTCADDFTRLSTLLETHVQKAKATATAAASSSSAKQLRLPAITEASASATMDLADNSSGADAAGLVLTETTIENISRVLDVVDNPAPLLLEGPTGVCKSATVNEAARRHGKRLLRFNMSSSITPDDLMGRVVMKAAPAGAADGSSSGTAAGPGEGFVLQHQLQPFAAAFAAGDWLLLDELNLAPDDVLQCIEQALDTGAVISNYSSHKIFARKTAGGKRTYQVALLLDVSQSMQGHLQQCSLEVLAMLADALGKVGLDDFVVMTFGAAPVLVKGPDTAWDQASQLALLEQVNCKPDQHLASMDAAAIQAAAALLGSSNSRAAKKIFVISDGYGTSGLALAAALQQAEQAGVEVVGLSVGFDRSHVPMCYQRWATAKLPSALPDALQALYAADDMAAASSGSAAAAAGEDWTELMPVILAQLPLWRRCCSSEQRVWRPGEAAGPAQGGQADPCAAR
uniref:VWFA domain-containing protein n=1 Tax=Tetradesmus obliquus TaxID=3088 RepID=A0A383V1P5_TETOB|eukprot:jgi/Sobl393_1/7710/SZX59478.1